MIVSILTDNHPGGKTAAEHGLSYLIEHDHKKILFDTGQTDLFMRNAKVMGKDLTNIDTVVLSHGHFDHGNGLVHLKDKKLICHPGCFVKRYRKADMSYIGLNKSREALSQQFELITSATPYPISDRLVFLGEIPRITDFESQQTSFAFEDNTPDFVMDDSAVALFTDKGLFVITGCGHSGVVNTLEHARKVTGEKRIYGIMGGFHLKRPDKQTQETIKYLKSNQVSEIYPSHCTELPALSLFYQAFQTRPLKTGMILEF